MKSTFTRENSPQFYHFLPKLGLFIFDHAFNSLHIILALSIHIKLDIFTTQSMSRYVCKLYVTGVIIVLHTI